MKCFYHAIPNLPLKHHLFEELSVAVDGLTIVEDSVLAGLDLLAH